MAARDPEAHLHHAFVGDDSLTSLPRRERMVDAACRFLAARFVPGRRYHESEVNELLAGDAPDHATLRRLLIDRGFLRRADGWYWPAR